MKDGWAGKGGCPGEAYCAEWSTWTYFVNETAVQEERMQYQDEYVVHVGMSRSFCQSVSVAEACWHEMGCQRTRLSVRRE